MVMMIIIVATNLADACKKSIITIDVGDDWLSSDEIEEGLEMDGWKCVEKGKSIVIQYVPSVKSSNDVVLFKAYLVSVHGKSSILLAKGSKLTKEHYTSKKHAYLEKTDFTVLNKLPVADLLHYYKKNIPVDSDDNVGLVKIDAP